MPEYLRKTNLQNPQNPVGGPFQYANKHEGHAFSWLTAHPDVFQAFHGYVHTLCAHRPSWTDMYPVNERLVDGLKTDGDASAFVDLGGGVGQSLQDFSKTVPEYKGRLVLQELEEVIGAATAMGVGADKRIELQVHDFFTPQPIKGARAYFMRTILHDWPDEQCRVILKNVREAMEPGYSTILISDCVSATLSATRCDILTFTTGTCRRKGGVATHGHGSLHDGTSFFPRAYRERMAQAH